MNKSSLKTFAIESRRELMGNIERTLNLLGISRKEIAHGKIMGEEVEIGGKLYSRKDYDTLVRKYNELGYEELVEETAYTWFNRLTALAYMEINGYTNEGLIFSSTIKIAPDIMDIYNDAEFFQNFSEELKERVHTLRDDNKLEELFSIFVEGKCKELATIMPFMFDKNRGYSELLFPTGLLMEGSFLVKLRNEMLESRESKVEDDGRGLVPVELIGWLYQFYNSEKKDEVFEGLKKNQKITKENIPAATQLFTPKWIVKYMVENSLGKLGIESLGVSEELKSKWRYYIDSESTKCGTEVEGREIKEKIDLEDIKIIDPAMGSGHMLTYSFDVLADIYEDLGWGKKETVLSILKNNIFGLEIDERAGQLASFAIMMKGRERFPRLFKVMERLEEEEKFTLKTLTIQESNNISEQTRNLMSENSLENLNQLLENFKDGKEYGSILKLEKLENLEEEFKNLKGAYDRVGQTSIFNSSLEILDRWNIDEDLNKIGKLIEQQRVMTEKFDVVVTNPPYMGNGGMNDTLKKYLKKNYPDSEKDMMTVFMDYAFDITKRDGFITMINLPSWMFLSSFEELRKKLIENSTIVSMVDNGRGVFGSDFGSVSFVLKNRYMENYKGTYRRLIKKKGAVENNEIKEEWFLDKEFNKFQANQKDFEKIPGSPVAYWVSDRVKEIFEKSEKVQDIGEAKQGLSTADNDKYLREWSEVEYRKMGIKLSKENAVVSLKKWFPINKGGEYKKWYGNQEYMINWEKNGLEIKNLKNSVVRSPNLYFQKGLTWTKVTSSKFSVRYCFEGEIFSDAGMKFFSENDIYTCGFFNSKIVNGLLHIISPTLNFEQGNISSLPLIIPKENKMKEEIESIVQQNISISKQEWDSREISWDFESSPLINFEWNWMDYPGYSPIAIGFEKYSDYWREQFVQMHKNEEELNKLFIEIYELQDEMDESVKFEDVTLLKKETEILEIDIDQLTKEEIDENEKTAEGYLYNRGVILDFNQEEIVKQFLSYGVGCIMGRYSLDKKGLIIANSDDELITENNSFTIKGKDGEVRHQIENPKFIPEPFGIIPVVKENIFSNDIVEKIVEFVRAVYGEATLEENLDFITHSLGRKVNESSRDTLRRYFIKDFYKDHLQRYKKRPIYWMMNSGKRDSFSALIYIHRYENNTIGRVRADYLVKYQETLDRYKEYYDRIVVDVETVPKDKKEAEKKVKELDSELKELRDYANEVKHIADLKICLDLDDGVKINYEKFGKMLGKI